MLNNLLDGQNLKRSKMGGVRTAAEIINLMKTQQEEAVITAVREFDGELARKLSTRCSCSKTVEVDDRSIQRLLQEVDSESLLIALKGAEQPLREVPAQHVPACGRYPARRHGQPWPGTSVSGGKRTKAILLIVRRLAETGEMVIGSGDDTMSDELSWKRWTPDDLSQRRAHLPLCRPTRATPGRANPS